MKGFIFMNNTPPPAQIPMPGMAPQQPQPPFLKGYAPQTPLPGYPPQTPLPNFAPQPSGQSQQPGPRPERQKEQEVKFYKSGFFGFSSAAGKFQRDSKKMLGNGWHVKQFRIIGLNVFLQRIIAAVYER